VFQELGRTDLHQLAMDRLLTLLKVQPENERALFNLAMISMDEVPVLYAADCTNRDDQIRLEQNITEQN
jgi:hypothetical protein